MSETAPLAIPDALRRDAAARLTAVRDRIEAAARRAGRDPAEITLVGVAKRQSLERIAATVQAGLHVLGENFVQETREMRPKLEAALAGGGPGPRLAWRMVGRLQRNKLALAVALFDAIESVDRIELVAPLGEHAARAGRVLEVLVQVHLGDEPQKGGCPVEAVPALARAITAEPALRLGGLMTVPPAAEDPEAVRPWFRRLRTARDAWAAEIPALAGSALSMGMSNDFEVAIEEGATLVRVGTALFGPRTSAA
ncbi:MAG: YggS family pyridoxal phosphate-dependent enzyme [Myxococcota bacterium]